MLYVVITLILFILSFAAGMMGLGVAFIATPVLGLFDFELKHVIMPWSLWLNRKDWSNLQDWTNLIDRNTL